MINDEQASSLIGAEAFDVSGNKIGKISQIYLDDQTGQPEFATVKTGMFGTKETFVPLAEAGMHGDGLKLPFAKEAIQEAPRIDSDGHLSQQEEAELYHHYGLDYGESRSDSGLPESAGGLAAGVSEERGVGRDVSGPTTDDAMTRSEEELRVGTEQREQGRVRLRKYVVTEQQQTTVPVSHEEVRLEREPITDANRDEALSGPDISDEEHEVVLTEERPVVDKETVPRERVRLGKETVRDQETVSGEVRKEQIDLDDNQEVRNR